MSHSLDRVRNKRGLPFAVKSITVVGVQVHDCSKSADALREEDTAGIQGQGFRLGMLL